MKLFLITPYSIDPDYENKRRIVEKILMGTNLELVLAEDKLNKGSLSAEKTIMLFKECDFFIADLSFERPSCYYELGYLQALDKEITIVARENSLIHQLLERNSIDYYSDLIDYKKLIEEKVRKLTKN